MMKRKTKKAESAASRQEVGIKMGMLTEINRKLLENPSSRCRIPGKHCVGFTVRNHSIQEEGVLSEIAEARGTDRFVKKLTWDVLELANQTKAGGGLPGSLLPSEISRMEPKEILIGDASIMYVACNPDDNKAFQKIEPGPGVLPNFGDEETLFQFPWRALLFRVSETQQTRSALIEFRAKAMYRRDWDKRVVLRITGEALAKIERICERLQEYEDFFWDCYTGGKFEEVQHIVKQIPSKPSVAASEFADIASQQSGKMICTGLTVYPYSSGHYIVISFLKCEGSLARPWADARALGLDGELVYAGEFLTHQLMNNYRNIYLSPLVYRSLTGLQQLAVETHFAKQWFRLARPDWGMPDFVQSTDGNLNFFPQT